MAPAAFAALGAAASRPRDRPGRCRRMGLRSSTQRRGAPPITEFRHDETFLHLRSRIFGPGLRGGEQPGRFRSRNDPVGRKAALCFAVPASSLSSSTDGNSARGRACPSNRDSRDRLHRAGRRRRPCPAHRRGRDSREDAAVWNGSATCQQSASMAIMAAPGSMSAANAGQFRGGRRCGLRPSRNG